jgi:3-phosphoglycerate kinase
MNPSTIDLLPIENKRVFIRVDFNVPLTAEGEISDDTRILEALPTMRHARQKGSQGHTRVTFRSPQRQSRPVARGR